VAYFNVLFPVGTEEKQEGNSAKKSAGLRLDLISA